MKGCVISLAIPLLALDIAAQQPSFHVQTADGHTSFHNGDPIVLNLTIATPTDGLYVVAPWVTPRGGEFDLDTVAVSPPTGWSDPLALYFKQGTLRTGHGWQWPPLVQTKPVHLALSLNQWVRFDEPGDYSVTFTTHRVSGATEKSDRPTLSSTVKLHIIAATPEWESARITEIRSRLPVDDPLKMDAAALRVLKYLGTPDAIDLLTKLMRNIGWYVEYEASIALDGVSDAIRSVAVQSMERRIAEPDFPVSVQFFTTFSFLQVKPGSDTDSIEVQTTASKAGLRSRVFASVPAKDVHARAQTVQTLLFFGRNQDARDAGANEFTAVRFVSRARYAQPDRRPAPALGHAARARFSADPAEAGRNFCYSRRSKFTLFNHRSEVGSVPAMLRPGSCRCARRSSATGWNGVAHHAGAGRRLPP